MSLQRTIKYAVWIVVVVHAIGIWMSGAGGGGLLFSNLIQLASAVLAAVACLAAARRLKGFPGRFWALMGLSFLLWAIAQSGWTYYEDFLRVPVPTIAWLNVLFFFFVAPMFGATLLPAGSRGQDAKWPLILDVTQLGIVCLTAYLYFFYVPTFWYGREAELNQAIRLSSELRNYVLLGAFVLRVALTGSRYKQLFAQMAIVIGIYAVGESLYFHLTPAAIINTGRWFDLTWSVPFALAATFASREQPLESAASPATSGGHWKSTLSFHVMPLLIPLIVMGMATRIVAEQLTLAAVSVAASILCAAARVFTSNLSQEKATSALRETEERFRLLFTNNPQPSWVIDQKTLVFIEVNAAALAQYGYTREEVVGCKVTDLMRPEEVPAYLEHLSKESSTPFFGETVLHSKDGRGFHVSITATTVMLGGRLARMVLAEDISARKIATEELRKSQQKLALHIQRTPLAVIEWDTKATVTEWNQAAERVFGYNKEEAVGQHVSFILPEHYRKNIDSFYADLMEREGGQRSTNENITKSGKSIICEWYNTPLVDLSGQVLGSASLVQDVTEKHILEQKLLQSQKMEAIGTLAGGVAHDFNNLLTVITGYSYMLREQFKDDLLASSELQEISDAAERAASLTQQLLTFSRKQVNNPILMDLNDCVRKMETMLRRLIGEDIELVTALSDEKCLINADMGQMEQVIMNLAVNARDAMPQGGRLLFQTGVIPSNSTLQPGHPGSVFLSANDNGCGMDESLKAHIFEPFFTTKLGTGTGLGLSTVFGIVEQNGGNIHVTSQIGVGSTFKIVVPRALNERSNAGSQRHDPSSNGSGTILLVEDEFAVRQLARQILEGNGYEVLTAESGADAADLVLEFSREIHLLVTDVVMPRMSGPELVKRLRVTRPDLKVLFVSGYTDKAFDQTIKLDAKIKLLQKPFSPQSLAVAVRNALIN